MMIGKQNCKLVLLKEVFMRCVTAISLAIVLSLSACSTTSAIRIEGPYGREHMYVDVADWVCERMYVKQTHVLLPEIIFFKKEALRLKMEKEFGIFSSNRKKVVAAYLPRRNEIWAIEGVEDYYIAHELAHWVQFMIEKRIPADADRREKRVKKMLQRFEAEAFAIQEKYREWHGSVSRSSHIVAEN